jgi:hypothetical protein
MAIYWLTFRVAENLGGNARRLALYEAVRQLVVRDSRWWKDPTSFILFQSEYSIDDIAENVKETIDVHEDIVLIRDAERRSARVMGQFDRDLFGLMDYMREI